MKQEELTPFEQAPPPENTERSIEALPETPEAQHEMTPEKAVEIISSETEEAVTEEDVKLETGMNNLGFSGEEVDVLKQETGIGEELKVNTEEIRTLADEVVGKLKAGLRVLGVTLPMAMGQGNALAQNNFEASNLNQAITSGEVHAEKVKMLELKSFGGQEHISSEEWKMFQKYRFMALNEENEKSDVYGVLPDGSVFDGLAEAEGSKTSVSPNFKQISSGVDKISQLEENYKEIKLVKIHQHPIHNYNPGFGEGFPGQEILGTVNTEDIKQKKLLSAWPPSILDLRSAVSVQVMTPLTQTEFGPTALMSIL